MTEYRFRYAGGTIGNLQTVQQHKFEAEDDHDAFTQKAAYLKSISGKYITGSMEMHWQGKWRPVPDPLFIGAQQTSMLAHRQLEM